MTECRHGCPGDLGKRGGRGNSGQQDTNSSLSWSWPQETQAPAIPNLTSLLAVRTQLGQLLFMFLSHSQV